MSNTKIIILLDQITHNHKSRGNPMFQMLRLNGHYTSALEFQTRHPCTIVRSNHKSVLKEFVKENDSSCPIIIIYCGHGSPSKWCIGITRHELYEITKHIDNLTIVSDNCFSDTMNMIN